MKFLLFSKVDRTFHQRRENGGRLNHLSQMQKNQFLKTNDLLATSKNLGDPS